MKWRGGKHAGFLRIMGIEFADKTIAAFDPDKELLGTRKQVA